MIRKTDELNNLNSYSGEIDWKTFYDAMELPEEREEERVKVADKLFGLFLALFVLVEAVEEYAQGKRYPMTTAIEILLEKGLAVEGKTASKNDSAKNI